MNFLVSGVVCGFAFVLALAGCPADQWETQYFVWRCGDQNRSEIMACVTFDGNHLLIGESALIDGVKMTCYNMIGSVFLLKDIPGFSNQITTDVPPSRNRPRIVQETTVQNNVVELVGSVDSVPRFRPRQDIVKTSEFSLSDRNPQDRRNLEKPPISDERFGFVEPKAETETDWPLNHVTTFQPTQTETEWPFNHVTTFQSIETETQWPFNHVTTVQPIETETDWPFNHVTTSQRIETDPTLNENDYFAEIPEITTHGVGFGFGDLPEFATDRASFHTTPFTVDENSQNEFEANLQEPDFVPFTPRPNPRRNGLLLHGVRRGQSGHLGNDRAQLNPRQRTQNLQLSTKECVSDFECKEFCLTYLENLPDIANADPGEVRLIRSCVNTRCKCGLA